MAQRTEALPTRGPSDSRALQLVIVDPDATRVMNVGRTVRTLQVGRQRDADVPVADAAVSERHAVLHLATDPPEIEDLGSTNGTWVRGRRIRAERLALPVGEAALVGNTTLLFRRAPLPPRQRKVWTHHQLMSRLEQECERVRSAFALLRIRVPLAGEALARALAPWLMAGDLLAHYGGNDHHVLLIDASEREAERRQAEIAEALGRQARLGLAVFARDGAGAEKLVAVAAERCHGQRGGGAVELPGLAAVYANARRIAGARTAAVLVTGETGTGKDVLAQFLHAESGRNAGPYVAIDCGTLSPTLAASELFGHYRGAFTGAEQDRAGAFEAAQGGTLLLDEVQNLSAEVQMMLLRVLETRAVKRLGAQDRPPIPVDVRVIATSNRDLKGLVTAHEFREDLYHRLARFTLELPPLRQRPADIAPLAREFLAAYDAREGKRHDLSEEVLECLAAHPWPGNVRELTAVMERLVVLQDGPEIDLELPPLSELEDETRAAPTPTKPVDLALLDQKAARRLVLETLIGCYCYKNRAAAQLGMSKNTLLEWMRKLDIPVPPPKSGPR